MISRTPDDSGEPEVTPTCQMVLMFTDLVGSTALKVRIGGHAYAEHLAKPHLKIFRDEILASINQAKLISYTGDGFFASFATVEDAIHAALRFQYALKTDARFKIPLEVRIGIHSGQVALVENSSDGPPILAGHAADMCARVMSLATGGQILLTRHAADDGRQFVREHPSVETGSTPAIAWMNHGRYRLKGKEEDPLEIFEVGAVGIAPLLAPVGNREVELEDSTTVQNNPGKWQPANGAPIPGLPSWRVIRKLGEGGFGEAWLATHRQSRLSRVYKFCFDTEKLVAFRRENTLGRLLCAELGRRSDISRPIEVELETQPYYLASEFYAGGNLEDWSTSRGGLRTIPVKERISLFAKIVKAVSAAHSVGVIHKDIKPANILIATTENGYHPVLSDFGIGALADKRRLQSHNITYDESIDTSTPQGQSRGGTRMYQAPEVHQGNDATVASDIYSLGIVLYQLMIGDFHFPLGAEYANELSKALIEQRDYDSKFLTKLVAGDILACVSERPENRLSSTLDLLARVETIEYRVSAAQSAESSQRLREQREKQAARQFQRLVFAIVVLLVLAMSSVVAVYFINDARRESKRLADALRVESATLAFEKGLKAPFTKESIKDFQRAIALVSDSPAEKHNLERIIADRITLQGRQIIPSLSTPSAIVNFDFSPNGRFLAAITSNKTIHTWNADSGLPSTQAIKTNDNLLGFIFSLDGEVLATLDSAARVEIWETSSGRRIAGPLPHVGDMKLLRFSEDREFLITLPNDKTIALWKMKSGVQVGSDIQHSQPIFRVAIDPFNTEIVTLQTDGKLCTWSTKDGAASSKYAATQDSIADFSMDSWTQHLLTISKSGGIVIWKADGLKNEVAVAPTEDIRRIECVSRDGSRAIVSNKNKQILTCNCMTGASRVLPFQPTQSDAKIVAISPSGAFACIIATNNELRLYDTETLAEVGVLLGVKEFVGFSPDGEKVAAVLLNGVLQMLNTTENSRRVNGNLQVLAFPDNLATSQASFSPDGRFLAAQSFAGTVQLWDLATGEALGEEIANLEAGSMRFDGAGRHFGAVTKDRSIRIIELGLCLDSPLALHHYQAASLATFTADGAQLVTNAGSCIDIWDAASGVRTAESMILDPEVSAEREFSRGGEKFAAVTPEHIVSIWDRMKPQTAPVQLKHDSELRFLRLSADATIIATASTDQKLRLWRTADGSLIQDFPFREPDVGPLVGVLKKAGDSAPGCCGATAPMPVGNGQETKPLDKSDPIRAKLSPIAISPNNQLVAATVASNRAQVWTLDAKERKIHEIDHGGPIYSIAFSPDSQLLVSASADGTAKLWSTAAGLHLNKEISHGSPIYSAQFSHDGLVLVTTSANSSICAWNGNTGELICGPLQDASTIKAVSISPDGRYIAAALEPNIVSVWDVKTGKKIGRQMRCASNAPFQERAILSWSPDGSRIASTFFDRTVQVWTRNDPIEIKPLWSELSTQQRLGPTGGAATMTSEVIRQEWKTLTHDSDWSKLLQSKMTESDNRLVRDAERVGHWHSAAFHLERLRKTRPAEGQFAQKLPLARKRLENWQTELQARQAEAKGNTELAIALRTRLLHLSPHDREVSRNLEQTLSLMQISSSVAARNNNTAAAPAPPAPPAPVPASDKDPSATNAYIGSTFINTDRLGKLQVQFPSSLVPAGEYCFRIVFNNTPTLKVEDGFLFISGMETGEVRKVGEEISDFENGTMEYECKLSIVGSKRRAIGLFFSRKDRGIGISAIELASIDGNVVLSSSGGISYWEGLNAPQNPRNSPLSVLPRELVFGAVKEIRTWETKHRPFKAFLSMHDGKSMLSYTTLKAADNPAKVRLIQRKTLLPKETLRFECVVGANAEGKRPTIQVGSSLAGAPQLIQSNQSWEKLDDNWERFSCDFTSDVNEHVDISILFGSLTDVKLYRISLRNAAGLEQLVDPMLLFNSPLTWEVENGSYVREKIEVIRQMPQPSLQAPAPPAPAPASA
jgi:WD40 repeat protein/class 3 adenylate cyclase/tRNA A-37 threonylcarbamoyl transferase component Bud32